MVTIGLALAGARLRIVSRNLCLLQIWAGDSSRDGSAAALVAAVEFIVVLGVG